MEPQLDNGLEILERLSAAQSGTDVVAALEDVSVVAKLAIHAKLPTIRKAVMLLSQPDPSIEVQARLRRLAFLAAFSAIKPLTSIVDEFASRALAEPLSDFGSGLTPQEKLLFVSWITGIRIGWISDFAVKVAVVDCSEDKLCHACIAIVLSRAASLSQALQRLTNEVELLRTTQAPLVVAGKVNLCISLAHSVSKAGLPPGKGLSEKLRAFILEEILQNAEGCNTEEKTNIVAAVSILLIKLAHRFQGLLQGELLFEILFLMEKQWVSPGDRKWKQFKQELFFQIEKVATILALNGLSPKDLVRKAKALEALPGATEKMFRGIGEENDILSEEVATALSLGGVADQIITKTTQDSRSEVDSIAQLLLRADELNSVEASLNGSTEKAVLGALLEEINQLAARKGVGLDGERNSTVSYDPIRQRTTAEVPLGGRVRILSPGVVRKSGTGLFLIIQAIVEPDNT